MESIQELFNYAGKFFASMHINAMYLLLWIAAGYIQKIYFGWFTQITIGKKVIPFNAAWKTLILGTLFSLVYAILLRDLGTRGTWVEFCASYVFATSMYELFVKNLVDTIINYISRHYSERFKPKP